MSKTDAGATDAISHLRKAEEALADSSLEASQQLVAFVKLTRLLVELEREGLLGQARELLADLEQEQ